MEKLVTSKLALDLAISKASPPPLCNDSSSLIREPPTSISSSTHQPTPTIGSTDHRGTLEYPGRTDIGAC
nr:hypothetical protein CFP56_18866 [Quercus suber]